MPSKRANFYVHPSPSRLTDTRARKRFKPSNLSNHSRHNNNNDQDDEEEEAYETEVEEQDQATSKRTSNQSRNPLKDRSTSSRFTSRTYIANSPRPRTDSLLRRINQRDLNSQGGRGVIVDQVGSKITQHAARNHRRLNNDRPFSPLPINHSLPRLRNATTKIMPTNKRSRDPSVVRNNATSRLTRRTSGMSSAPLSGTATPDPKRTRKNSGRMVIAVSSDSSEEDEGEEQGEVVMEDEEEYDESKATRDAVDDGDSTETEGEVDQDDMETQLREWPPAKLRALRRSELVELYLVLPSSSTARPDIASMKKETLISLILAARKPPSSALTEQISSSNEDEEEDDEDSTDASPQPRTSLEPSPEDERRSHRSRSSHTSPRGGNKTRRNGTRKLPLTPPLTSGEEEEVDHSGDKVVTDEEDDRQPGTPRVTRRRTSQIEMPPPPLRPTIPPTTRQQQQQHRRTRSSTSHLDQTNRTAATTAGGSNRMNEMIREEGELDRSSPVAHRTRGHRPPSNPSTTTTLTATNAFGSPARPGRAAKQKAFVRLGIVPGKIDASGKGKGKAEESDEDQVMEDDEGGEEEDEEGVLVVSSGTDDEGGEGGKTRRQEGRRRRSSRSVKQVETPPSDADEESGGEEEDEEVETEVKSHLRATTGTRARNGKVVKLHKKARNPELGEVDDEDEDMDAEYEEDEDAEDDEEQDEDELDLLHATSKTLLRRRKDDLVRLCEERDLSNSGRTKKELVDALLQWRDQEAYASSADSDDSTASTLSNASTETARGATKTARLAAASRASARGSRNTPLLMRDQHPISPEKPRSPNRSKEREHQEDVNTLDLESLQLQDKEIPPDKLTKLELVGSGGFKDVYKGTYRRRTIAICDIRGHLTDMDIKELGLLRDLRHENIVQFIGVSIPKQPSAVPVMIVTELCANGDLFDYIRGVEAPRFRDILDIMVGIAKGIEYLHDRTPSIIHRDIKSSNVLITSHGVAKIADFGLARIKTSTKSMIRSLVGTVNWQAPELWHPHPRYNEKVDVYSVGLVMWEMLQWHQQVKRYPFEGMNEHAIYADVGQRQLRPSTAGLHRRWGGEIVDLMSKMWDQDPSLRPSMSQVVHRLKQLAALEKAKSRG